MKAAMRSGDSERRDVIRYLRSSLTNQEIEQRRPLTDSDVIGVIQTQIKQRIDAAELFRKGTREDLAAREEGQVEILKEYLPAQLSVDELRPIVSSVADEVGASSPSDMGKVMPRLIETVGAQADGRTLSQLAREELVRRGQAGQ